MKILGTFVLFLFPALSFSETISPGTTPVAPISSPTTTAPVATPAAEERAIKARIQLYSNEPYRPLQCPTTSDVVKNLSTKIKDLKAAIKKDGNCEPLKQDVSTLSNLVTKDRDQFLALVTKGQVEGLTKGEEGLIEKYVNGVTVTSSNLLDVISGRDACFDEDKQGLSVEFLTGLIGEGAKIISVFAGPQVGATVQITSEVVTGFLKAMKTIRANRRGYHFDKPDQRVAYAASLCSLFEYRKEVRKIIYPNESARSLISLKSTLETQLLTLQKKCTECAALMKRVDNEYNRIVSESSSELERAEEVWPKAFEQSIAKEASAIDKLYTRKLGSQTYRSLKTLTWIPLRLKTLEENPFQADLVLGDLLIEMHDIETFMINQSAAQFMRQITLEARKWDEKLRQHVLSGQTLLAMINQPTSVPWTMWSPVENKELFGTILEDLDRAQEQVDGWQKQRIVTFFDDLEAMSRFFNMAVDVVDNYCNFFVQAKWFRTGISSSCTNDGWNKLKVSAANYAEYRVAIMTPPQVASAPDDSADQPMAAPAVEAPGPKDEAVTDDLTQSLDKTIQQEIESDSYVQRRTDRQTLLPTEEPTPPPEEPRTEEPRTEEPPQTEEPKTEDPAPSPN